MNNEKLAKFVEMQTEIMRNYPPTDAQFLLEIYDEATALQKDLEYVISRSRESYLYLQVKDVVEKYYDIGTVVEMYQIFGGYINTSFGIYTEKDGEKQTWFVRKYKSRKELDSLLFEHKMLHFARNHGYEYGAVPIYSLDGKTYHAEIEDTAEGEITSYFAVFNYVDGKVLYDWIPNWADDGIREITVTSAARSMAMFHNATHDFDPEGRHGDNIMDNEDITVNEIIRKFPETLKGYRESYRKSGYENVYTAYFDANYELFKEMSEKNVIPQEDYDTMLVNVCHCDFHAGNFKYKDNGEISGSFDYDMAKIDSRLFEIGLAAHYCFASWLHETNGIINLDRVVQFIKTYNETLVNEGSIEPLTETEKKYLYEVCVQGTLYAFGWCSSACVYDPTLDPYEYFYYAQHFVACLRWLKDNEAMVREAFKEV